MLSHSFVETKTPLSDNITSEFKKYLKGYKNGKAQEAAKGLNVDIKGKEALST
jgi:hypothetical protein